MELLVYLVVLVLYFNDELGSLPPPLKVARGYVFTPVCLFVCLSVCLSVSRISKKKLWTDSDEIWWPGLGV